MKRNLGSRFLDSLNYAINGILYAAKNERNFRVHIFITVLVLFFTIYFNLTRLEVISVFFAIVFVLIAELLNSVIENVVDLITKEYNKKAKIAKDMAAGIVLLSAINAGIVGFLVFYDKFEVMANDVVIKVSGMPIHIAAMGILIILALVVLLKSYSYHGTPLQGGMPSGHTAIAFGITVSLWMITYNIKVFLLGLVISILVAESRLENKTHTLFEVIVGGVLGSGVMFLIFKLLGY